MKKSILLAAAFLSIAWCAPASSGERTFVRIDPGAPGFSLGGKPWHPFGCNYYDPGTGWAPKLWKQFDPVRVEKHFQVLETLGVNVVRVFLTAGSFFPEPPALDPEGLRKFDAFLEIARRHGIRVHPTGPDHWEGTPAWRRGDLFADPKVLEAQVSFWKAFAARYRDEPLIFAYDILNEPHVSWKGPALEARWREWLAREYGTLEALARAWGGEAGGLAAVGDAKVPAEDARPSRSLSDFQRFRESLGESWVKVQAEAIRSVDPNHLITVGLIQWSIPVLHWRPWRYAALRPSQVARHVDFLSVHFYPLHGDPLSSEEAFEKNLAYLELVLRYVRAGAPARPLLVGEFGWYGGGAASGFPERPASGQARWCRAAVLQGRGIAAGWLNWAYADTPTSTDLSKFSGLVTLDDALKPWGEAFRELAKDPAGWTSAAPEPPAEVLFEVEKAIVDPAAGDALLEQYFKAWKPARGAKLSIR